MWLNVYVVIGVKYLLPHLAAVVFELIVVLAAAVISVAGVTLGIFVGEYRADSFSYIFADKIFRSNKFNGFVLPFFFL